MKVYLLSIGPYDDARIVGVYATRTGAERALLDRVYAGESVEGASIEDEEVME